MLAKLIRIGAPVLVAISACAIPAHAETTRRSIAVMSLIGDRISVVTHMLTVGSNIDRNDRQELAMPDDTFDAAAVRAASEAVRRRDPGVATSLYTTRDPKLFALQEKLIDSETQYAALAESLRQLLAQSKATHLLLITKYRAEANLRLKDGYAGSGMLTGIGFYVDPYLTTMDTESRATGQGFFAPYAYLRLMLIDASTLQRVGESVTTESRSYGTGRAKDATVPWDALTAQEKVDSLRDLIGYAVEDAAARIFDAR